MLNIYFIAYHNGLPMLNQISNPINKVCSSKHDCSVSRLPTILTINTLNKFLKFFLPNFFALDGIFKTRTAICGGSYCIGH